MVDRLEQRRHLGEAVGMLLLRHGLQMLVQPKMPRLPRLFVPVPELRSAMLAHEGMGVQLVRVVMAGRRQQAKVTELVQQVAPTDLVKRRQPIRQARNRRFP